MHQNHLKRKNEKLEHVINTPDGEFKEKQYQNIILQK